jgi:hypothetical protein
VARAVSAHDPLETLHGDNITIHGRQRRLQVTYGDVATLLGGSASEELVVWYLHLVERHAATDGRVELVRSVLVFPIELLRAWQLAGHRLGDMGAYMPPTQRVDVLRDFDVLLIPVQRSGGRWAVVSVLPAGATIPVVFHDPIGVFDDAICGEVLSFLRAVAQASTAKVEFKLRTVALDNPGVPLHATWMLWTVRSLVMKESLPESSRSERIRRHIAREILADRLLPGMGPAAPKSPRPPVPVASATRKSQTYQSIVVATPITPTTKAKSEAQFRVAPAPAPAPAPESPRLYSPSPAAMYYTLDDARMKLAAEHGNLLASESANCGGTSVITYHVHYDAVATLLPGSVLSEEIVRWYLWMIARHSQSAATAGWARAIVFDQNPEYRPIGAPVENYDLVLYPRFEEGRKWSLIAFFPKRTTEGSRAMQMAFFDPLSVFSDITAESAKAMFNADRAARGLGPLDFKMKAISPNESIPASAVVDLGALILAYARTMVAGEPVPELKYIDKVRLNMIREVLSN